MSHVEKIENLKLVVPLRNPDAARGKRVNPLRIHLAPLANSSLMLQRLPFCGRIPFHNIREPS